MSKFVSIVLIFCVAIASIAQNNDNEFIIGNKIFKPNTNWFKLGQGISYHFSLKQIELNTTLAYSFKLKKQWFQAGYHVSSDRFFIKPSMQRLNDVFVAYGLRKETMHWNIAAFAGLSFAYGGTYHHSEWGIDGSETKWYKGFNQLGVFGTIDITFKPVYDMGIGISIFGSYNKRYEVAGILVHLYLSGGYKGKIE